ncbi:ABC transporter substrate-binding protein [Chitinophagales bacterium]|nr:ABC transporter substrate-binding protein [Chitinophagales bacterium]
MHSRTFYERTLFTEQMMKRILGFILIVLLTSCGSGESSTTSEESGLKRLKGDVYAGGMFQMNETEYLRSLFPLNVTEVSGNRITNQIYEGLVQFDQTDLTINPSLAEKWDIDEAGLKYIFHLRKGVYFHDDPCFPDGKGRLMTVEDVKWNLDQLFSYSVSNKGYDFYKSRVKGAQEYYESTKDGTPLEGGCAGVTILDENRIQLELAAPYYGILNLLALPFANIYPKEAFKKYGVEMRVKAVGTGPFVLATLKENDRVILKKNPNYWGKDENGNQLPYLDGIKWTFIADQKSELLAFEQGRIDMLYRLPAEMIDDIVTREGELQGKYKQYQFQERPSMSIQYYGFKMSEGRFANNRKLRQAFNYAIDKQKIVNYTVKGAGVPGNAGCVPPSFVHYDISKVKGYDYDPAKAKVLMAEAGYPNGKGFDPLVLQINSGGTRNEQIAEAVQKMLKENLNISVSISKLPFAQHLEAVETSKAEFWRSGWVADYPDPENFINLYNSEHIPEKLTDKSYLNSTRYRNQEVTDLYYLAEKTADIKERHAIYMKADQLIINDAPFIPVYYYKDRRLLQSNVRAFPQNAMEYRNLREVYFVPEG